VTRYPVAQFDLGSGQDLGHDLGYLLLVSRISLAELSHHCHPRDSTLLYPGGCIFYLGFVQPVDLLAPEVYGPIKNDGLAQVVVLRIGPRTRYQHQGHRIRLLLGNHICDQSGA